MKYALILLIVVALAGPVLAQDETLFSGDLESGGYGGPLVQVTQMNGETGVLVGGQGGWIINHQLVLGGKGYGLANSIGVEGADDLKLEFGAGGFMLEYMMNPSKLVHFSIHSMFGAGAVRYVERDYDRDYDYDVDTSEDTFFIAEPGFNLVLNVTDYMRVGGGATYRYINGVNYETLTNSDLSGVSGQVFIKFGSF
jgi:hypothetical protein